MTFSKKGFDEYREYGENNGPISALYPMQHYSPKGDDSSATQTVSEDWIKRQKDDPHDEMLPMSMPGDKDYEC